MNSDWKNKIKNKYQKIESLMIMFGKPDVVAQIKDRENEIVGMIWMVESDG